MASVVVPLYSTAPVDREWSAKPVIQGLWRWTMLAGNRPQFSARSVAEKQPSQASAILRDSSSQTHDVPKIPTSYGQTTL